MRILAVIPACEGSVTLPNKNMRVIHGKPMIYYVIRNALLSKYITDVIVTSNSNDILTVAKRMDVMIRRRDSSLCNAQVSLDRVVWDVFEQLDKNDYDYVVTMQSVSPTLHVDTLDTAFEKMFEEGYDTLISVKQQSQFYWSVNEGIPVPMQSERMNRHCLPPFYMEIGAFLITRTKFIREDSRVGDNVGIYELTGDEAIDVFSFGDLKQAENALERKSAAIYVNGNNNIGLGHISRALQVADEMFAKPDIYYDQNITDPVVFGDTTYNLVPVNGLEELVRKLREQSYDIVINDVLNTSKHYMESVRSALPSARIINYEDEGEGAPFADIVVNALYETGTQPNVISGSQYYIIPKMFLLYDVIPVKEKIQNVIVTFGGADPSNYTEMVLHLVDDPAYQDIHFYVVVGKANKMAAMLSCYDCHHNVTILYNIDNMAEIMSQCDAAVSSRGRTCFELAALGIPTLSIAQHEREERHDFVSEENGFLCLPAHAGEERIHSTLRHLLSLSQAERLDLQQRMLRHDLRNGRKHVSEIIHSGQEQK